MILEFKKVIPEQHHNELETWQGLQFKKVHACRCKVSAERLGMHVEFYWRICKLFSILQIKLNPVVVSEIVVIRECSAIEAVIHILGVYYSFEFKPKLSHTEFVKRLYGDNSEKYAEKLEKNKRFVSCDFEKFSSSYTDKALARKDFNDKYGSSTSALLKRHGGDVTVVEQIRKSTKEKQRTTYLENSEEDLKRFNAKKAFTLENYIARHGQVLGEEKYNEASKKKRGLGSLAFYVKKYGDDEGKKRYNDRLSKYNFSYRYWMGDGLTEEEAREKIREMIKNRKNFSRNYCLEKYGQEEGERVWKARTDLWQNSLNKRPQEDIERSNKAKGFTLQNYALKYGELGEEKFEEMLKGKKNNGFASKEATKFFLGLYKKLRRIGIIDRNDVFFAISGSKEYFLRNSEIVRFYDFTIPKLKFIVEYNGSVFHPREGDIDWKSAYGRSYDEVFERDKEKLLLAESKGYTVRYVWDCENKDDAITNIINELIILEE